MTDTKQKIDLMEELDDIEAYKGKWVNIDITTKGVFKDESTYENEQEAIEYLNRWLEKIDAIGGRAAVKLSSGAVIYHFPEDYISTIQMPAGE